jgi:hypothetical protein
MTLPLPRTARDVTLQLLDKFRAITSGKPTSSLVDRISPYLPAPLDGPEADLASLLASVAGSTGQSVGPRSITSAVTTSSRPPQVSRQPLLAGGSAPRSIDSYIEPLATPRDGAATVGSNDAAGSSDVLYYANSSADSGIVPEAVANDPDTASPQLDSESQPVPTAAIERVLRMLGGSFDSPPAPADPSFRQLLMRAGQAGAVGFDARGTSTSDTQTGSASPSASGGVGSSAMHEPTRNSQSAMTQLELTFSNFEERLNKALARVMAKLEGAVADLQKEARATRMRELQRRAAYRGFR